MLKYLNNDAWVYDLEWVPNPATGRAVYGLPLDMPDGVVVEAMYSKARDDMARAGKEPTPRPYLKTALCRIVSIAAVKRHCNPMDRTVTLELKSLPAAGCYTAGEGEIVHRFLDSVGRVRPQLVGYNAQEADLPMLLQRAVAHELRQPRFCKRPNKPWEGIDYFAGKYGHDHVDLKVMLSGFREAVPSLHEICVACGIPGKLDTTGMDVVDLHLAGEHEKIMRYGQCDVLSTYQLFLRVILLAGFVTTVEYEQEQQVFDNLLAGLIGADDPDHPQQQHLSAWLAERQRLRHVLAAVPERPKLELVS